MITMMLGERSLMIQRLSWTFFLYLFVSPRGLPISDPCSWGHATSLFHLNFLFQSLSTFYCRFHGRPLGHFGLSVSHQARKLWLVRVGNTKVKWTLASKCGLWCEHAQRIRKPEGLWFQTFFFYQTVLRENCEAQPILFWHENPPMPNSLTTYVHHHSRRVVGTLREDLTWLERFPELH